MKSYTIVLGLGEVGRPLLEVIAEHQNVIGVDLEPVNTPGDVGVMHICFPFEIEDFVETCVAYIQKYQPQLTIINSTVLPGTTRAVYQRASTPIVYSPVRGKHKKMAEELLNYTKFIGGIDEKSSLAAAVHFQSVGMKTKIFSSPEALELAKLSSTTYFGLLIAWAQEVERYCKNLDLEYDEVITFYEEISYFPQVKFFPGVIGGHCVMPNIAILKQMFHSNLLDAIENSNQLKIAKEVQGQKI
jgi:UDP-N-acetyl-D-mannosaminuronate dehydrogenase